MRLTGENQTPNAWASGSLQNVLFQEAQTAAAAAESLFEDLLEEPPVLLELSFDALNKDTLSKTFSADTSKAGAAGKGNGLIDNSGKLTKLLVSAKSKGEVQNILSRAYENLGEAIKAAASGDSDAMEVVRRLNKLIRRANRKFRDLTKESEVRDKQKRAEKKELEMLAQQLKDELKRKIAERKQRERRYLRDADPKDGNKRPPPIGVSAAAVEAKMLELALKMAHMAHMPAAFHAQVGGEIAVSGGEGAAAEDTVE